MPSPAVPAHAVPSLAELRVAGLCYLAIIALGLWSESYARGSLIVAGDAAATARNIAASPGLWRAGLLADLAMQALDIPVIVLLWRLLRPLNENLALMATALNLVQTAVLVANRVQLLAPLELLGGAAGLGTAFSPEQRELLALLAVQQHGQGFGIGLIFFGLACLIRGWPLAGPQSPLPRPLGWLLLAAGLAYLVNSLALLISPPLAQRLFPWVLLPALVGELLLALRLLQGRLERQA